MTAQALPTHRFDTAAFSPEERFDRWQQTLSGLCSAGPPQKGDERGWSACATAWHMGGLIAIDLRLTEQVHRRTRRHVRADQIDHYRLALKVGGRQSLDADGHCLDMRPGDLLLVDQARPWTSFFQGRDGRNIVLYLPRDALEEALPRPLGLHGMMPHGGLAGILADHLRSLARHLPTMTMDDAAAAARGTLNLVAASIASTADNLEQARPVLESTLLRQVCRYIDLHLTEESLSADSIAAAFRLSRASLYRLFEPLGGVARHIKERRLLRIHGVLSASTQPVRILRLAEDHGFKTAAHMSREFRSQFGYSPSEARRRPEPTVRPAVAGGHGGQDFYRWMRALRG